MATSEATQQGPEKPPERVSPEQMQLWANARTPENAAWRAVQKFSLGPDSSGQWRIGDERTRRFIIVGDVHGHLPELKQLLGKIEFDKNAGDHVILVGDLVNKGPDSPGVVQFAIDIGAHAVKGNNEDRVLTAFEALRSGKVERRDFPPKEPQVSPEADETAAGDIDTNAVEPKQFGPKERNEVLPNLLQTDFETAVSLSEAQVAWLSGLPVILDVGRFTNAAEAPWNSGSVVVAHAGLVPDVSLEKQDPWAVMNLRSLVHPPDDFESEVLREAVVKAARKRVKGQPPNWPITDEEMDEELKRIARADDLEKDIASLRLSSKTIPIEVSDGDLWREAWNRRQNQLQDPSERTAVVYGHDAKAGLQVEPLVDIRERGCEEDGKGVRGVRYAFGLDSGCVYGKHLTALVIEPRPEDGGVVHRIVQVEHIKTESDNEGSE